MPILLYNLIRSKLFQKSLWRIFKRTHSNVVSINKDTMFCRCEDIKYSEILKYKDLPNVDRWIN